jgi:hypothetical protein
MRKLSYFGLILLLLGIACVAVGAVSLQNVTSVDVGNNKIQTSAWYFACNLTRGNTYWVYIESNAAWGVPFNSGDFTSAQPVNVTITSPGGTVTSLQAFYDSVSSSSPYYRQGTPPAIVYVTYDNADYSSISVDTASGKIRFSVIESGAYTARVLDEGWVASAPPDFFVFYKEVPVNSETSVLLASGGGVLGALGGVTLVVSIFRKEGARRKRIRN